MKDFISVMSSANKVKDQVELYYSRPEEIIRKLFYEQHVVAPYVPSKFISPSGMNCPISCCYKLRGIELPESKESFFDRSKADVGTDRHARIQEFLSKTDYWVNVKDYVEQNNLPLIVIRADGHEYLLQHKFYPLRFKCDGLLKIGGKYYVLEIKTEGEFNNSKRRTFNPAHEFQGATYVTVFNAEGVIWLYEGRDSCDPKTYLQPLSKGDRQTVIKYIEDIVKYRDNPFDKFSIDTLSKYSPYKDLVKKEYKEWKKNRQSANR